MIFKWLVRNKTRYSALVVETDRCVRFFDALNLEGAYKVKPPWVCGVLYINVETTGYFFYFLLKKFSLSRSTLISAWIYAMYKYTHTDKIVTFYFSPKPFFLKIAQLGYNLSIHCVYPSLVTDNKNISIHRSIFHYVHNESDVTRLVNRNVNPKNIIITGSPYLSLYKRFLKGKKVVKKYDICLISQVVEELFKKDKCQYHHKIDKAFRKLLETVNLLYRDYSFQGSLCVALRLSNSKEASEREKSYFSNILNCVEVNFIENDPESYSSYHAMEQSVIGLTLNSTVAHDMRYIGVESIYAIDENIKHRPFKKDIEYYFQNGYPAKLSRVLEKVIVDLDRNMNNSLTINRHNSIEMIRTLLNNFPC
jgi:hypothetical protein